MKEMKQNRKIKYTKMVLRDALMELMQEKKIAKITVKELCIKADLNRTTFYTHYADPYDLLHKIEAEVLTAVSNAIADLHISVEPCSNVLVMQQLLQYIADNKEHIQVLLSEQGSGNFAQLLFQMVYEQCELRTLNPDSSTQEFYFIFVLHGSIGLIQHWLTSGRFQSPAEMAEIIFAMVQRRE